MMLASPVYRSLNACFDVVTMVHSARSPYVWFCEVMAETVQPSFCTRTIFEWFCAR